jgi:hypothetical protein
MEIMEKKLYSLLSNKLLDEQKNGVSCPHKPQTVSNPTPSQAKAPEQPLHHVENLVAQNIPHHCVVKATPTSASKFEQNSLHHQRGSRRELLFEKTHKMHHVPHQFFAQIITLADKTRRRWTSNHDRT